VGRAGRADEARESSPRWTSASPKTGRHFRKEAQGWRNFAQSELKGAELKGAEPKGTGLKRAGLKVG